MKLTFKLMVAIMLVIAILLLIHGYLVVQREIRLFEQDMKLHAYLLGNVLASSIADIWRSNGPERVQEIIDDANQSENLVHVKWVWLNVPDADTTKQYLRPDDLSVLRRGQEILVPHKSINDSDFFHAYFPVKIDSTRLAALELSQPLGPMQSYIRSTIIRKVILFVAFVLVGGILVLWLGAKFVGQPIQSMVNLAKRVGEGDLTVRTPLENHSDELSDLAIGLNKMVEDLHESKMRLDKETARRIDAIEQLHHAERLATVGKLASGLAHELGTPLNVVSGRAKMIASEEMNKEEISNNANIIRDQSERMIRIIRQMLDFARSRKLQKTSVELSQLLENVASVLSPIAEQKKISLNVTRTSERDTIEVDQDHIKQVFTNLIVNAMQAMPDGGEIEIVESSEHIEPPAYVRRPEGDFACVKIIDQGTGISKEDLSRIFTPFFTRKEVGEGTGLGLSIVHGIVKEHGGWITVDSQVGKGSTFSVYLPLEEN